MHEHAQKAENGFAALGVAPKLLDILTREKYTVPTPIQVQAIPVALEGTDVMGIAQTGTGKTMAFGLPMLQRIAKDKGRGLVVLPTRELALQVDEELQKIGKHIGLRTAVLIGGQSMRPQLSALARKPHIIVVTPGRLIDHLEQRTLTLKDVRVLVLDEADRMLDMGFEPQIKKILQTVPPAGERQTLLFSATMPPEITRIAETYMRLPVRVEIARAGTAADQVAQEIFVIHRNDKLRLLEKLLKEYKGTVLVFSRTKHGAKKIMHSVERMGHTAAEIHSNRSLAQRRAALDGFKSGRYRVLIATDIAARGIDVKGIEVVINFDLPDAVDDYVHRIGRTGRAGADGRAISFATPDQRRDVMAIERLIRKEIPRREAGDLPPAREAAMPADRPRFGGRDRHTSERSYGGGHSSSRSSNYPPRPAASASRGGSSSYGGSSYGKPAYAGASRGGHGAAGFNRNNDRTPAADAAPVYGRRAAAAGILPSSWTKPRRRPPTSGNDRRFDDLGSLDFPKSAGIRVHFLKRLRFASVYL